MCLKIIIDGQVENAGLDRVEGTQHAYAGILCDSSDSEMAGSRVSVTEHDNTLFVSSVVMPDSCFC